MMNRKFTMIRPSNGDFHGCLRAVCMLAIVLMLLGACTTSDRYDPATNDPLEPMNRGFYTFNKLLDLVILEPVSRLYGAVLPQPVKDGVSNALHNLRSPVIFANDLLQGERERAGNTLGRFMINTFLGVGGIFDPATFLGHPKHDEDFGQTLAVWNVPDGPYLMLPFFGPSSPRDAFGLATDKLVLDPFGSPLYASSLDLMSERARLARTVLDVVNTRYELTPAINDLRQNAIDEYATIRSVYRQSRAAEIRNGRAAPTDAYEDIFNEDFNLEDESNGQ